MAWPAITLHTTRHILCQRKKTFAEEPVGHYFVLFHILLLSCTELGRCSVGRQKKKNERNENQIFCPKIVYAIYGKTAHRIKIIPFHFAMRCVPQLLFPSSLPRHVRPNSNQSVGRSVGPPSTLTVCMQHDPSRWQTISLLVDGIPFLWNCVCVRMGQYTISHNQPCICYCRVCHSFHSNEIFIYISVAAAAG